MLFTKDAPTLDDLKNTIDRALEGRPKESDLLEIKKQIGKIQKLVEKSMNRDQVLDIVRHMTEGLELEKPRHRFGKSWKFNEKLNRWESRLDVWELDRAFRKSITDFETPDGSGTMPARMSEIWQERPHNFDFGMGIPRVQVSGGDSQATSVKVTNLAHAAVADGANPVVAGETTPTTHTLTQRKSLVKISTAMRADVPEIAPALEMMIREIYMQEMARQTIVALHDGSSHKVVTGLATSLPTGANLPGKIIDMESAMPVQYRDRARWLAADSVLSLLRTSTVSATGPLNFDLAESIPMVLGYQMQLSGLMENGATADDHALYFWHPECLRIFEKRFVESELNLDPSSDFFYLVVRSRFDVKTLDGNGIVRLETEA